MNPVRPFKSLMGNIVSRVLLKKLMINKSKFLSKGGLKG